MLKGGKGVEGVWDKGDMEMGAEWVEEVKGGNGLEGGKWVEVEWGEDDEAGVGEENWDEGVSVPFPPFSPFLPFPWSCT